MYRQTDKSERKETNKMADGLNFSMPKIVDIKSLMPDWLNAEQKTGVSIEASEAGKVGFSWCWRGKWHWVRRVGIDGSGATSLTVIRLNETRPGMGPE